MVARVSTVAFQGIAVLGIDVQVQISSGLPAFTELKSEPTTKSPDGISIAIPANWPNWQGERTIDGSPTERSIF